MAKNSLVGNINRRKKLGISRPKSKTTVSDEAYREMQAGWPSSKKRRKAAKRGRVTRARKR